LEKPRNVLVLPTIAIPLLFVCVTEREALATFTVVSFNDLVVITSGAGYELVAGVYINRLIIVGRGLKGRHL